MVSPDLGSFNNYHLFSSFEERINSPECLHKAVDSHQHVVGALLRPAFGDGEDGPVDILRVGHDITALSLCSTSSHLWWVVGLPRTLRLIVALRGREREVFNRISIHQHSDLEGMEVLQDQEARSCCRGGSWIKYVLSDLKSFLSVLWDGHWSAPLFHKWEVKQTITDDYLLLSHLQYISEEFFKVRCPWLRLGL